MKNEKKYEMKIDPSILELLGPNLYTNIYYILAELIANAYDADANNVYIIEKEDCLVVEDDGHGMSYENKDIERYLQVAESSRKSEKEAFSRSGTRKKMGRKGVGKLAALSISDIVKVMTISDGEKSGFILARHPRNGYDLDPIPEDEIVFETIANHGTAIVMTKPQYQLNKTLATVKKNLIKIFPLVDKTFRIHLFKDGKNAVLESIDKTVSSELCSIITLGKDFEKKKYPVLLTRSMDKARAWLRDQARGSQQTGVLVTKVAARFKPLAVNILPQGDEPTVHWFLEDKMDVRSSNYLEDAATEIQVQGLELDYACVLWDADMRREENSWGYYKFSTSNSKWSSEKNLENQKYMLNAYRVLLTRARQGMVICVPEGNHNLNHEGFPEDPTRLPEFYDSTYEYLKSLGIKEL